MIQIQLVLSMTQTSDKYGSLNGIFIIKRIEGLLRMHLMERNEIQIFLIGMSCNYQIPSSYLFSVKIMTQNKLIPSKFYCILWMPNSISYLISQHLVMDYQPIGYPSNFVSYCIDSHFHKCKLVIIISFLTFFSFLCFVPPMNQYLVILCSYLINFLQPSDKARF